MDFVQRTLVLIKPDAVKRGLVEEILARFERAGLKVVETKQIEKAEESLALKHYPVTDQWLEKVGHNTLSDCEKFGVEVVEAMGTSVPKEIGEKVHRWNVEFLTSGSMVAAIVEGTHAIEAVRKLVGPTIPLLAPAGTIRGDYSTASAISENAANSAVRNLVHASGSPEEAEREIKLWFDHP
ncbi:nucleoside-diphosphate kinase [Candidatus Daviesbacteria bacterium]|nr:nucleoside-diphosphate kinase [Candidatus Daviesbacteria bacterium]